MDKYSINYNDLHERANQKKAYKYEDVKDRVVRVAWDVVKFECDSEDIDGLWKIEKTQDGEVIVAAYDASNDTELSAESQADEGLTATASANHWQVIASRDTMNIFYKGDAIRTIASSDIGVSERDLPSFCGDIARKLNTEASYKTSLLNDMPDDKKAALLNRHPELTK